MALYAIGDLHLSLTADKPMEVFGPAWENYTERIGDALSRLTAGDVLVLAGDTSWGIDLNEAEADFRFLDQFPCKKYLVKGNHDYWWTTAAKWNAFLQKTVSPPWRFSTTTAACMAVWLCAGPGAGSMRRTGRGMEQRSSTGS